jgi:hypothetical protein
MRSDTGTGLSPSFFRFPRLIIILPFLRTHISPPPAVCDCPDHASELEASSLTPHLLVTKKRGLLNHHAFPFGTGNTLQDSGMALQKN